MRGPERGVALHNSTWRALFRKIGTWTCSAHVYYWLCLVAWWSYEYAASRVSLSSVPALSTALVISVGGDLRTWWGEARNEVQAAFLTFILGRMHHHGACRVLAQYTHTILRSAFGESIEFCVWHRSVNYAAGAIGKRCNWISMISCAILRYC